MSEVPRSGPIAWFAGNPVAANLIVLLLLVGGVMASCTMRRELIPTLSLDIVLVSVPYPGATPTEVEQGILLRLEEAISDLEGIDSLTTTAAEGIGSATIEVADGYAVARVLDEVKSRVDAIVGLPAEAEEPIVQELSIREQVMTLALTGPVDVPTLRRQGEALRADLLGRPGISQVVLQGLPDPLFSIEVSAAVLQAHDLSFAEVEQAIRLGSVDLPAGAIRDRDGHLLLRIPAQARSAEAYARIVVRSDPSGGRLHLGDLAEVHDTLSDDALWSRFDGERAAMLAVYRVGDQDILEVADAVRDWVAGEQLPLAAGMRLRVVEDRSILFAQRVDTLARNGLSGLAMVLLALTLFLRVRQALWVSVGIMVSFAGALVVMPYADATINMISLFAFILVLGIVVDDAIVVAEAVTDEQEQGASGVDASIRGTRRVMRPVVFAVLTTVISFAPLLFVSGVSGRFFRLVPIVVIACLVFSLLESLFVLPAHLAQHSARSGRRSWLEAVQDAISAGLKGAIVRGFLPLLDVALRWRWVVLAGYLAFALIVVGYIRSGRHPVTWFPSIAADFVNAKVAMPEGTPPARTEEVLARIEAAVAVLRKEYPGPDGRSLIGLTRSSLGYQPGGAGRGGQGEGLQGDHLGEVAISLEELHRTAIRPDDIARRWRQLVGDLPGVDSLSFDADLSGRGSELIVRLAADTVPQLQQAIDLVRGELADVEAVVDSSHSLSGGKEELLFRLNDEGQRLGLREADLARQIRHAYHGAEAQRLQRGRDELRILVRRPAEARERIASLQDLRITLPGGGDMAAADVVAIERGLAPLRIQRVDRRRVADLRLEIDPPLERERIKTALTERVFPALTSGIPRSAAWFEGRDKDQGSDMRELLNGFVIAMLAMYVTLAIAFRSYIQPFLLMSAIPFAAVGAVFAHLVIGMPLSLMSAFGVVALAGVVVNDNLVLIDAINRLREQGMPLHQALLEAGRTRFRPILLTTLTTFLGVLPLLWETSVQARFLIPMVQALAWGVVLGTTVTLVLVPCLYAILEDLGLMRDRTPTADSPPPGP